MNNPDAPDPIPEQLSPSQFKRKAISRQRVVEAGQLCGKPDSPLLLRAAVEGVNLRAWANANQDTLEADLNRHGAILFRHFHLSDVGEFEGFISDLCGELLEYRERSSPRHNVHGNIYTSTDYPADQSIFPHNENSYQRTWPLKIFFFCLTPALEGGETPLVSSRAIYQKLDPRIREKFERKQVMYVRNYGGRFGLPWQKVFQTEDPAQAQAYCLKQGIETEWLSNDRLRTRQVRPAVARHPYTNEWVWFNHAVFFHTSTLRDDIRQTILEEVAGNDLPSQAYYGDGSALEASALDELRGLYREQAVLFQWERGDLLMVDNMLTAHGRQPFKGPRSVVVGMAEPFHSSN
ncbi:MAG: TauD/TfdA family dioxygenase [Blastocatellia bacterium]